MPEYVSVEVPASMRGSNLPTQLDGKVIISNSEVTDFLKCERKHYYAYILGIVPKKMSTSLSRGIIGHQALAEYYANDRNPSKAFRVIDKHAVDGTGDMDMLAGLRTLIGQYFEYYQDDDKLFDIIEVETPHYMDLGEDYSYGMRLDLLTQHKIGPYAGEKILYDHKFQYDFMGVDDLALNVQIPKYIGTLRNDGHDVARGMLNQLRWRETKENKADISKKFKREPLSPPSTEIREVMREQVLASERIADRKVAGAAVAKQIALRSVNAMTCKNCPFVAPCKAERTGEDITVMLAVDFQKNEYGYTEETAEDL